VLMVPEGSEMRVKQVADPTSGGMPDGWMS
jgi:hypothetical protein